MFPSQSITLTSNGEKIKLHLISTGAVSVKTKFRDARRSGLAALFDILLDKHFTEWMPIWVMVIEHKEGIFLIDAGEISEVLNRGYFKSSGFIANWFDTTQFKFKISREEEIDMQLNKLGIAISNVSKVILSHLHFDHVDGIKYFPSTPILVNRYEWEKPFGDLPKLYPSWFKPVLLELNKSYEVFENVFFLTEAKDILLLQTPGHTYGHCSVLVKADEGEIFFAADICYSQEQVLKNKFPGNNTSNKRALKTYDCIRQYAQSHRIVFLPSHDPESANRLAKMSFIRC